MSAGSGTSRSAGEAGAHGLTEAPSEVGGLSPRPPHPDPLAHLSAALDRYQDDGDVGALVLASVEQGWLSGQVSGGDVRPLLRLCHEHFNDPQSTSVPDLGLGGAVLAGLSSDMPQGPTAC